MHKPAFQSTDHIAPDDPARRAICVIGMRVMIVLYRQIARLSEWQSTREEVFALAEISLKAAVEGAQKRFSFGTPGTRYKVTGLDKFGYPDVNCGISNGPRFLKCTGPCLLDGSEDIWGLSRIGRSACIYLKAPYYCYSIARLCIICGMESPVSNTTHRCVT
jgi:hypothetical protein